MFFPSNQSLPTRGNYWYLLAGITLYEDSFAQHVFEIHLYVSVVQSCLLLDSIPLCDYTIIYLAIYLLMDI